MDVENSETCWAGSSPSTAAILLFELPVRSLNKQTTNACVTLLHQNFALTSSSLSTRYEFSMLNP